MVSKKKKKEENSKKKKREQRRWKLIIAACTSMQYCCSFSHISRLAVTAFYFFLSFFFSQWNWKEKKRERTVALASKEALCNNLLFPSLAVSLSLKRLLFSREADAEGRCGERWSSKDRQARLLKTQVPRKKGRQAGITRTFSSSSFAPFPTYAHNDLLFSFWW